MGMRCVGALGALALLLLGAAPLAADGPSAALQNPTDISAQTRTDRPRTRIEVRPRRYYDEHYLPPNAVRRCDFWLATEDRPSGTVIVPRQHCWWSPPG